MTKVLPLIPRDKEVERIWNIFMQMDKNFPRSVRITPNTANKLSKYGTVRKLSRMDLIDIVSKKRRAKRSIVYLEPLIDINKNGKRFFIKLP